MNGSVPVPVPDLMAGANALVPDPVESLGAEAQKCLGDRLLVEVTEQNAQDPKDSQVPINKDRGGSQRS